MPNMTIEEFEPVYDDICERESMPASEEVRNAQKELVKAFDNYVAAVGKDAFYWGYTIAMRENRG